MLVDYAMPDASDFRVIGPGPGETASPAPAELGPGRARLFGSNRAIAKCPLRDACVNT
jgi:hypothetical protein